MAFTFNFGGLKNTIKSILDRDDISTDNLELGVKASIRRLQRAIIAAGGMPELEKSTSFTQTGGSDSVSVYSDLEEVKHWLLADRALERKSLDYITGLPAQSGTPTFFARAGNTWQLYPKPEADTDMTIIYYSDQSALTNDADTNDFLVDTFTALIYGSLTFLGELYADERTGVWQERFNQEAQEVILAASSREFAGSETSIMPPEGSVY